jgi:hypothetical protein
LDVVSLLVSTRRVGHRCRVLKDVGPSISFGLGVVGMSLNPKKTRIHSAAI